MDWGLGYTTASLCRHWGTELGNKYYVVVQFAMTATDSGISKCNMKQLPCYGTVNWQIWWMESSWFHRTTSPEQVFLQHFSLIMWNLPEKKDWLPTGDQFKNFGCQNLISSHTCDAVVNILGPVPYFLPTLWEWLTLNRIQVVWGDPARGMGGLHFLELFSLKRTRWIAGLFKLALYDGLSWRKLI